MKVLATIWKEFLLLVRDPGSLALILLMPLVLVVVMTSIQSNAFRALRETAIDILIVDEDRDAFSAVIENSLQDSPNINLIPKAEGKTLTRDQARHLVQRGKYQAAVIIPENATNSLQKKIQNAADNIFSRYGSAAGSVEKEDDPPVKLEILFEPTVKADYKQTVAAALEKRIAGVQLEWFIRAMQERLGKTGKQPEMTTDFSGMIRVEQAIASKKERPEIEISAVQHNVPAWSMFAMFFILFPLAGNFIKEREDGSMLRLCLISGSHTPVISGKFVFYLFVCLVQLALMICVGLYLMPLIGFSKLQLGTNPLGIVLTGLAVAMAATGYGLLIAVYFKMPQQALSFGAISVVILAALGGVWVPVFAMPDIMQHISPYSPLNWGLEAFNDLFLRSADTIMILPDLIKLTVFAIAALTASILIHRSRNLMAK